jgi:hypothetical protein
MSLLRKIQDDLANPNADLTTVLRTCKILAGRLGSDDLARWVELELSGYPASQPLPECRRLAIIHYASFMNVAWQVPQAAVPLQVVPEQYREDFHHVECREGIAKIVTFARSKNNIVIQKPELIFVLQKKMYPEMSCQAVWGEIPNTEFEQLAIAVGNRILDFAIQLEAENPAAGEAAINSRPVPEEKLRPLVNNFFAPVANLAQHSHDFTQTTNLTLKREDLSTLVTELSANIGELNLDGPKRQKAEAQIATLRAQLTDEPNPVIVEQAGRTLRNVTEEAIASLIATAVQPSVWHTIQSLLALFPHK